MNHEWKINQFNKIISDREEDDIAAWLIQGLEDDGDFEGLFLTDEPDYLVQLQELFDNKKLKESLRNKFKKSLLLAVKEWSPRAHGAKIINELAILGAYIRASRIIDHLSRYILDEWLSLSPSKKEDQDAIANIFGVLAGFAPDERVSILFENLFFSKSLPPQFAAQLFLGLCKCDRHEWVKYVPTFIEFLKQYPQYYEKDFIVFRFERIVSLSLIAEKFKDLYKDYRKYFLKLLLSRPKSPSLVNRNRKFYLKAIKTTNNNQGFVIASENDEIYNQVDDIYFEIELEEMKTLGGGSTIAYFNKEFDLKG